MGCGSSSVYQMGGERAGVKGGGGGGEGDKDDEGYGFCSDTGTTEEPERGTHRVRDVGDELTHIARVRHLLFFWDRLPLWWQVDDADLLRMDFLGEFRIPLE